MADSGPMYPKGPVFDDLPQHRNPDYDEAYDYASSRPLVRPQLTIKNALVHLFVFFLVSFIISILIRFIIHNLHTFEIVDIFLQKRTFDGLLLIFLGTTTILGRVLLRKALIGLVCLYQHYASEDTRRRCAFKPSCSEYAILALKKYCVEKALVKIFDRVVLRCNGANFEIDYP